MESEMVNITKIKDGYFLGDEATAANLDVIFQFKITHMINAAGPQILNAWENIGTKYLTLNWFESANQNLFDPKDEIANRIVGFIDDSFKNGEGFLVYSVRGRNRACLVVLIYFIRKFRWSLKKSIEFLKSKKTDIDIPSFFMNQLSNFEVRLTKIGMGPKSTNWNDVGTGLLSDIDNEEVLIRNTYINGSIASSIDDIMMYRNNLYKNFLTKRLLWIDNVERKPLATIPNKKDLILQNPKEIKQIVAHRKIKPTKGVLKGGDTYKVKEMISNQQEKEKEKENIALNNFISFQSKVVEKQAQQRPQSSSHYPTKKNDFNFIMEEYNNKPISNNPPFVNSNITINKPMFITNYTNIINQNLTPNPTNLNPNNNSSSLITNNNKQVLNPTNIYAKKPSKPSGITGFLSQQTGGMINSMNLIPQNNTIKRTSVSNGPVKIHSNDILKKPTTPEIGLLSKG